MQKRRSAQIEYLSALGLATLVSLVLFSYGALRNHSYEYSYLIWNLFLAWLPLILAIRLINVLKYKLWSSWEALMMSGLWLVFVPNSFYMISDYIHLRAVNRFDILYDAIMFTSFIYTGVVLGFSSLYLVHVRLKQRFSRQTAASLIGITLVLCSIAIYIGRDLRWNSWDLLTNPGGLLFDVSDRLAHPAAYPQMLLTISSFLVLLSSMYLLVWRGIYLLTGKRP